MAYTSIAVFRVTEDVTWMEAQEIARRATEGLLPLLRKQPGFQSYQLVNCGGPERIAVAVTTWATREEGEAGVREVEQWTDANVGHWIASSERHGGEVVVSS